MKSSGSSRWYSTFVLAACVLSAAGQIDVADEGIIHDMHDDIINDDDAYQHITEETHDDADTHYDAYVDHQQVVVELGPQDSDIEYKDMELVDTESRHVSGDSSRRLLALTQSDLSVSIAASISMTNYIDIRSKSNTFVPVTSTFGWMALVATFAVDYGLWFIPVTHDPLVAGSAVPDYTKAVTFWHNEINDILLKVVDDKLVACLMAPGTTYVCASYLATTTTVQQISTTTVYTQLDYEAAWMEGFSVEMDWFGSTGFLMYQLVLNKHLLNYRKLTIAGDGTLSVSTTHTLQLGEADDIRSMKPKLAMLTSSHGILTVLRDSTASTRAVSWSNDLMTLGAESPTVFSMPTDNFVVMKSSTTDVILSYESNTGIAYAHLVMTSFESGVTQTDYVAYPRSSITNVRSVMNTIAGTILTCYYRYISTIGRECIAVAFQNAPMTVGAPVIVGPGAYYPPLAVFLVNTKTAIVLIDGNPSEAHKTIVLMLPMLPTETPTNTPTTAAPTAPPTTTPTKMPTDIPTHNPSFSPTAAPTPGILYLQQAVAITGLDPNLYSGNVKSVFEHSYAASIGACTGACTGYLPGISIASTVTTVRRSTSVTFTSTVPSSSLGTVSAGCIGSCDASTFVYNMQRLALIASLDVSSLVVVSIAPPQLTSNTYGGVHIPKRCGDGRLEALPESGFCPSVGSQLLNAGVAAPETCDSSDTAGFGIFSAGCGSSPQCALQKNTVVGLTRNRDNAVSYSRQLQYGLLEESTSRWGFDGALAVSPSNPALRINPCLYSTHLVDSSGADTTDISRAAGCRLTASDRAMYMSLVNCYNSDNVNGGSSLGQLDLFGGRLDSTATEFVLNGHKCQWPLAIRVDSVTGGPMTWTPTPVNALGRVVAPFSGMYDVCFSLSDPGWPSIDSSTNEFMSAMTNVQYEVICDPLDQRTAFPDPDEHCEVNDPSGAPGSYQGQASQLSHKCTRLGNRENPCSVMHRTWELHSCDGDDCVSLEGSASEHTNQYGVPNGKGTKYTFLHSNLPSKNVFQCATKVLDNVALVSAGFTFGDATQVC